MADERKGIDDGIGPIIWQWPTLDMQITEVHFDDENYVIDTWKDDAEI